MPKLSKKLSKLVSLGLFAVTGIIKIVCLSILSGLMEQPCIAGWHVNEEVADNQILITIGLIPDIMMVFSIGGGIFFQDSNIGADPSSIIYNFLLSFVCIGAFFPFFGIDDCKSADLSTIKLLGIIAIVAGIFHLANGVVCLLSLADEEKA